MLQKSALQSGWKAANVEYRFGGALQSAALTCLA